MKVLVTDLIKSSGYSSHYFFKLLREYHIKNRIILNKSDIFKLYENLDVVNDKSYKLYTALKNIVCNNSGISNAR